MHPVAALKRERRAWLLTATQGGLSDSQRNRCFDEALILEDQIRSRGFDPDA